MLAAAVTLAIGPRMAREPGVIEAGNAGPPTAERLGKCDDLKANSIRIREVEFVLAIVGEAISFVRHTVQAPGTKPIAFGITSGYLGAALHRRFGNSRRHDFGSG